MHTQPHHDMVNCPEIEPGCAAIWLQVCNAREHLQDGEEEVRGGEVGREGEKSIGELRVGRGEHKAINTSYVSGLRVSNSKCV